MVITTDHVSHTHLPIVNNHGQVIGWRAVTAGNNQIIKFGVGNFNPTFD